MIWDEISSVPPQVLESLTKIFAKIAATGKASNLCLQEGFLPVPVHFYSPIPDLIDLEQRRIWDIRSELKGIDFRPEAKESFRQFWTEQYLLQAFLSFNENYEILLGMYYLMKDQVATFRQAFPLYDPSKHLLMGTSFWIRRKP